MTSLRIPVEHDIADMPEPAEFLAQAKEPAQTKGLGLPPITFTYRNWQGVVAKRTAIPLLIHFGATSWHPEPQWLMLAFDIDRQAERDFAMADMSPASSPVGEVVRQWRHSEDGDKWSGWHDGEPPQPLSQFKRIRYRTLYTAPATSDDAMRVQAFREVLDCRTFSECGQYHGWNITKLNKLVGNDDRSGSAAGAQ